MCKVLILFWIFGLFSTLFGYPFTDNGDGSVLDTGTNLVWQKCSRGQNNDSSCTGTATKTTWSLALLHCKNLAIGSRTWRLPNANELRSLVNPSIYSSSIPFISSTSFPSTVMDKYWTATTVSDSISLAFYVDFSSGGQDKQNKVTSAFVRCVSGP
jgi:hypothetical protein